MAKKQASKQKKMQTRVDFTPMVDMMMLLITFFMLCTSLSKPQSMELVMPSRDSENVNQQDRQQTKESSSLTVYVVGNNKIYHMDGIPTYDDPTKLVETTWGSDGIRKLLINYGDGQVNKMLKAKKELDAEKAKDKSMPDSTYSKKLAQIKAGKLGSTNVEPLTVIIKVTDDANYKNVVDILDEMQICCINTYMIDDLKDNDKKLLDLKGIKY